jgi:hypothetical protein
VHAAKSKAVVAELAIATVTVLRKARMESPPDQCGLLYGARAGEHLARSRPFLAVQAVRDSPSGAVLRVGDHSLDAPAFPSVSKDERTVPSHARRTTV